MTHRGLVTCRLCSKIFKKEDLPNHRVEVHQDFEGKSKCEVPKWRSSEQIECHEENTFNCRICAGTFFSGESYKSHWETHRIDIEVSTEFTELPEGLFKCCGKVLSKSGYSKHLKGLAHKGLVACTVCRKVLRKEDLLKHKAEIHKQIRGKLYCKACDAFFNLNRDLTSHLKSFHAQQQNLYECSICSASFIRKDLYKRHTQSHEPHSKNLCCTSCDYRTYRKDHLRQHFIVKHLNGTACYHCSKIFKNTDDLQEHFSTHTCLCQVCGKSFVSKSKREQHYKRVHLRDEGKNKE
ncbi:hypothetical protein FOCC_FOCC012725 [Frankliniella occidentalis]|nr:hypothetical protein FOCC_FOCC012725 [Frankliniella occidentalis]